MGLHIPNKIQKTVLVNRQDEQQGVKIEAYEVDETMCTKEIYTMQDANNRLFLP